MKRWNRSVLGRGWAPPGTTAVINVYGPTETTVHASLRESVDGDADSTASPDRGAVAHLAFLCWMGGCGRCRRVWSVSCMWPVPGWALGIGGGPG